ncbi:MAG: S1 RNA-binding domain-containing protein [Candidatus Woesearchaeota archaeon]|jgi:translation initiation factor 2 subunit 1|nr:S1 RNA-binding domain-containing protein [Candidatus Woesearchaeota archaeon]
MLLTKTGLPEEDELVICTVTAVQHHSVFARLDEYQRTGLIHISEVSPGRIRNIRDFVKEGKVIVCKVLRIHQEKGHIDLSLRRVNEGQRRAKLEEIKKEQFAEKLVGGTAKQFNVKGDQLYKKLVEAVQKNYETLYPFFEAVSEGSANFEKIDIDDKIKKALEESIQEKITPPEVSIRGKFFMKTNEPDGITHIKEVMLGVEKLKGEIAISYDGAGKYKLRVTSSDFKDAEKVLKKAIDKVTAGFEKHNGKVVFKRDDE